jgi:head-tail adaptor
MRIGSHHGIFTIQRQVQVGIDKLNSPNFVWMDWRADIFCEVEVRRGKEQFDPAANIRFSEEVWRFRTRYDEVVGIDASMQILHEGSVFNIKAVMPDGQKQIDCIVECVVQDAVLGGKPLAIAIKQQIAAGTNGQAYSLAVIADGGTAPYVFSLDSGTLPTGLSLNASTGMIMGTLAAVGNFAPVIKVADAAGDVAMLPPIEITVT